MEYYGMSILKRNNEETIVMKRRCSKCKHDIIEEEQKFCTECGRFLKIKPKYQCVEGIIDFLNNVEG